MKTLDTNKSKLVVEFLKDHQQFSRLLYEIRNLLEAGNIAQAQKRAIELDVLAGPHIAFEEQELYPRLSKLKNHQASEATLVNQHHDALIALRMLLLTDVENEEAANTIQMKAEFDKALQHAEHCGSLISLLTALEEDEQKRVLNTLLAMRRKPIRWTELEN